MSKRMKEMIIDEVGARLNGVRDIVAVDSSKLSGVTANKLRLAMKKKKISALTVRNKLAKQALNKAGVTGLDLNTTLHLPTLVHVEANLRL